MASMMVHSACLVASSAAAGVPEGSTEHWSLSGNHTRLMLWPLLVPLPSLLVLVAIRLLQLPLAHGACVLPQAYFHAVKGWLFVPAKAKALFSSPLCAAVDSHSQCREPMLQTSQGNQRIAGSQTTTQHLPVHRRQRTNMHSVAWSRNLAPHTPGHACRSQMLGAHTVC